jgi:hypothetical protein
MPNQQPDGIRPELKSEASILILDVAQPGSGSNSSMLLSSVLPRGHRGDGMNRLRWYLGRLKVARAREGILEHLQEMLFKSIVSSVGSRVILSLFASS